MYMVIGIVFVSFSKLFITKCHQTTINYLQSVE